MKIILFISLLTSVLISCSLEKRIFKNEPYVRQLLGVPDSIVLRHDSIVEVEISAPDSGFIYAYFECNDSNQVLMKRYESLKSKGVITHIIYKDNILKFDFKTDSARIAKSIIDKYSREKTITIQVDKLSTLEKLYTLEQKNASKTKTIWWLCSGCAALLLLFFILIRRFL